MASSGSINPPQSQFGIKAVKIGAVNQTVAPVEKAIVAEVAPEPDKVTLAARFQTTSDALQTEDAGNGQLRSKMTIALVPQKDQADLEKLGVIFPNIEEVRSTDGLSADGRIDLVPVDGTGNPETTRVVEAIEVDRSLLVKDAQGVAPIDGYIGRIIKEGSQIIPEGYFGVPDGTAVAPKGFDFSLATSEAGAKTESRRLNVNRISDGLGNFAQSSLAGIVTLPYISAAAPLIAVATGGLSFNKNSEDLKTAQDTLSYVSGRQKYSKTDKITLELGVGQEFSVSAKAEKQRLETKVRTAKSKLTSTGLLFASGASSVIGYAAAGGAFGTGTMAAALTGAVAATPYLAGAAMVISSGGLVLNSLNQLKSLSKEKAELLALVGKGETHFLKTIEKVSPELKRPIAIGEQLVPIEEQLKTITKEQRKHRLLATAMTGTMASVVGTVTLGASAITLAPIALAPAALLATGQSISKLKELSIEKKKLVALHETGATMAPRQTERQDGSWNEEKIPISTLLGEIEKKQKTHKLILTAVGSAGAVFGLTLGAGLAFIAAAPLLLIPAIIGAAMFPEKVKAFTDKVAGFVSGKFGEAGRSRKHLKEEMGDKMQVVKDDLVKLLDPLAEKDPSLFHVPTKEDHKLAQKENKPVRIGYFTVLNGMLDSYAGANSRSERYQMMTQIESALAQAPENAKSYVGDIRAKLKALHDDTEMGWVARDVAIEMKTDVTERVIEDDRVKARIGELGFPTENLEDQYRESLVLENSDTQVSELLAKSRAGDRDATLQLVRKEVFGAGRLYHKSQDELGSELLTKLVDALQRPTDDENLELVIKEVNHKLGRPMAPSTGEQNGEQWWLGESTLGLETGLNEPLRLVDFQGLSNALATLEKPLDLNATGVPVASAGELSTGPQNRMASAFRELHRVDSEAATQLGNAFATLNSPSEFEGLSEEEAGQKRIEVGLELTKAKAKLEEKAPDTVLLWNTARLDVEEEFFQRSLDVDFNNQVLARPELAEASQRLGVKPESIKALYMGILRAKNTGDHRALQGQLMDAANKEVDPAKSELLEILDRSMSTVAAQRSQGANDTELPGAPFGQPEADPKVQAFLQANPVIGKVLQSEDFIALSNELHMTSDEVKTAFLTLVQANANPIQGAEFEGRLQAGELNTVRTFQVGNRVGQLVQAASRPTPEVLAQQVEASMAGPVVVTVLNHPEIKALAAELKVDATVLMRSLLQGDLAGDRAPMLALEGRAKQGDPAAIADLKMTETLANAYLQVAQQFQQQQQQAATSEQKAA